MSAPTTVEEVKNQWAANVLADLNTNYLDAKWADLDLPTGSCFDTLSTGIFTVDLNALTALCSQVTECDITLNNYVPYALGFRFTLS